jgi:hypothetical protein
MSDVLPEVSSRGFLVSTVARETNLDMLSSMAVEK